MMADMMEYHLAYGMAMMIEIGLAYLLESKWGMLTE